MINVAGDTEGWYYLQGNQVTMQVYGNPCQYTHKLHALNCLYSQSTVVMNGCFFAVVKCADFGSSKYLLVQVVKADPNCNEEGGDPSKLHLFTKGSLSVDCQTTPEQPPKGANQLVELITKYDLNALLSGCYYKHTDNKVTTYYRVCQAKLQSVTVVNNNNLAQTKIPDLDYKDLVSVTELNRIVTKLLLKQKEITYEDILGSYVVMMAGRNVDLSALTTLIVAAVTQTRYIMEQAIQVMNSPDIKQVNVYKSGNYTIASTLFEKLMLKMLTVYRYMSYYSFYFFLIAAVFGTTYLYTHFDVTEKLCYIVLVYTVNIYQILVDMVTTVTPFFVTASDGVNSQGPASTVVDLGLGYFLFRFANRAIKYLTRYPRRTIKTTCVTEDNYKEVQEPLMNGVYNQQPVVEWNMKKPSIPSLEQFVNYKCNENKNGLVQVMPEIIGAEEPIIYHVCEATNFCAAKRQCSVVPKPDPIILNRFSIWFERVFEREILPLLENTTVSVDKWINHLSAKKQKPILKIEMLLKDNFVQTDEQLCSLFNYLGLDYSTDYKMFVKSEKQLYSDGKAPKNRCICSPNDLHKYVMGPVTWALEESFKNFHGYCGGASWNDLEQQYDDWLARGFTQTIQLDGSGFDRTQHQVIKDIVDQRIYKYMVHKISHVPKDTFERFALAAARKVKVTHNEILGWGKNKNKVVNDGSFTQIGAVFSGSCDTTLMNTLRMSLYNRFVMESLCGFTYGVQYELKSKGDDTVTVLQTNISTSYVIQNYTRVFVYNLPSSEYSQTFHGLGQIAKYFKIGGLEDIDFCSTETVYCPRMGGFKILRQLKRFITTTVWSRKAKNFTPSQMKIYLESLYQANLTWMNSIPIYRVFNYYLHKDCTGLTLKTVNGTRRITRPCEDISDIDYGSYHESDYKYSLHLNTYTRIPHELDMLEYFCRKYNWHATDVYEIERQLTEEENWQIVCPLLAAITH